MQFIHGPSFFAWQPLAEEQLMPNPHLDRSQAQVYNCVSYAQPATMHYPVMNVVTPTMPTPSPRQEFAAHTCPPDYFTPSADVLSHPPLLLNMSTDMIPDPYRAITPAVSVDSTDHDGPKKPQRRQTTRRTTTTNKSKAVKRKAASKTEKDGLGPFICEHTGCGKTFTRPYNLTSHMRTHTSDRPYPCAYCQRRFVRQHDRNRHEKLHLGIKPYTCSQCQKSFARVDALNRHVKTKTGCVSGTF